MTNPNASLSSLLLTDISRRRALALGGLAILTGCICFGSKAYADDGSTVHITVDCEKNAVLSRYDVDVVVNGDVVATLPHGTNATYDVQLADGDHAISFKSAEDSSVDGNKTFAVFGETTVSAKIECKNSQVKVNSFDVVSSGPDPAETEGLGEEGTALPEDDVPPYRVRLSVKCLENFAFSKYDIVVAVDGSEVGTLDHGTSGSYTLELDEGTHNVTIHKRGDESVCGSVNVVVEGSVNLSYSAYCTSDSIGVKGLNLASGSAEASSSAEVLERKIAEARELDQWSYTPESWEPLERAVADGEAVLADGSSDRDSLTAAVSAIDTATARLKHTLESYSAGSYEELMRYPDQHVGDLVYFTGRVAQVVGTGTIRKLRVYVGGDWDFDSVVLVSYDSSALGFNILEDDNVTIYGVFAELYTYTALLGNQVTVPMIDADTVVYNY